MKKESVQKFDLEAAFKALNEVEIPVVKGIRPNRENLQEKFNRKLASDILVEDYFDVGDSDELEQAQEEREAEIAKAKLARIEKIVDLEAETEEDLLPSYVGKFIMQCPQCMMLFYKNEEDIEKSEENPEVVNLNEPCQHCGNSSGYTLVGKVDTVGEDEAAQYDAEDFGDENELDLNFDEEPAEETSGEETEEAGEDTATEEGNEEELDLAPIEDEEASEESDEEEIEESLTEAIVAKETDQVCSVVLDNKQVFTGTKEECEEYIKTHESEASKARGGFKLLNTAEVYVNESIDKDLDAKLKAHNDYIEYLKDMISKEETSLANAKNEFVKKSIQSRIDALRADLEAALPEALKDEVAVDELPTPEEADMEAAAENKEDKKEKKESLTEGLRTWVCVFDGDKIGTVEAETEEDAYSKMEKTWPELPYGKYDGVAEVWPEDMDEALVNLNLDARGQSVGMFRGQGGEVHNTMTEDKEELDEFIGPAVASIAGATVANNLVNKAFEDLEEDAPVSTLKRKLAATELIVKELKTYPLFSTLSTRTIQRVLLPYYIENMGRADMTAQSVLEFFEYEGFATYVLDHFTTIDPLARKELLKADAQFMKIFMAYVNEYGLYTGNKDELEAGTDAFDAAFEIAFALNPDGTIDDADICRKTIQTFGLMYVAGKFDKALVVESLTEDTDNLDALLDSEEFKKPISDKEIEDIKAQYEGLKEEVAPGAESEMMMRNIVDTWESVEDLDDETFNKLTENYLTEVYSNVKSFEATSCDLKDNKLVIEGTITFKSGKIKPTTFVYEAKETSDKKVILEGLNEDFASEKAFTLNCKVNTENCLIVESLNYKYIINDTLVEGLLK